MCDEVNQPYLREGDNSSDSFSNPVESGMSIPLNSMTTTPAESFWGSSPQLYASHGGWTSYSSDLPLFPSALPPEEDEKEVSIASDENESLCKVKTIEEELRQKEAEEKKRQHEQYESEAVKDAEVEVEVKDSCAGTVASASPAFPLNPMETFAVDEGINASSGCPLENAMVIGEPEESPPRTSLSLENATELESSFVNDKEPVCETPQQEQQEASAPAFPSCHPSPSAEGGLTTVPAASSFLPTLPSPESVRSVEEEVDDIVEPEEDAPKTTYDEASIAELFSKPLVPPPQSSSADVLHPVDKENNDIIKPAAAPKVLTPDKAMNGHGGSSSHEASSTHGVTGYKDHPRVEEGGKDDASEGNKLPRIALSYITEGPTVGTMTLPARWRDAIEKAINRGYRIKRALRNEENEKNKKDAKRQKRDGEKQSKIFRARDDSVASETSFDDDEDSCENSPKTSRSRPSAAKRTEQRGTGPRAEYQEPDTKSHKREYKMLCEERVSRIPNAGGAGGNGKIDRRRKCATAPVVSESLYCGANEPYQPASGRRMLTKRSSAAMASNTTPSNITPSNTRASSLANTTGMGGGDIINAGPCEIKGVHLPMSKEQILGQRGRSWQVQCEKLLEAFEDAYIVLRDQRIVSAKMFFQPISEILSQFPDYANKIHPFTPVDLLHVKRMLDEGQMTNPRDFRTNVSMTFENWMRYFDDDENDNYRLAHRMQRLFAFIWEEIDRGESAIEASYQHSYNSHSFPGQAQRGMDMHSMYPRLPVTIRPCMVRSVAQATGDGRSRQRRAARPPARRTRAEAEDLAIEMHEEIVDGYKRLDERDQAKVTEWLNRGGDFAEIHEGEKWSFGIQSLKPRRRRALHTLIQKLVRAQEDKCQTVGYSSGRRAQTSAGTNTHRQHSGHQKSFPVPRREAGHHTGYDPALFSGNSSSDEPEEPVFPFRRNNPMPATPGRFGSGKTDRDTWQPSHVVEQASRSLRPPQTIDRSRSPPPSPFGKPVVYEPFLQQQTHTQGIPQTSCNNVMGGVAAQQQRATLSGCNMQQYGRQTPSSHSGANAGSGQANAGAGLSAGGYMQGTPGTGHPQSGSFNYTTHGTAGGAYGATSHRTLGLGHEGNNNNNNNNNNMGGITQGQAQTHSTHGTWNQGMEIGSHTSTSKDARDDMANFGESRKMPGNEIKRPTTGYSSPAPNRTYSMMDKADDVLARLDDEIEDTPQGTSTNNNWGGLYASAWPGTETSYE